MSSRCPPLGHRPAPVTAASYPAHTIRAMPSPDATRRAVVTGMGAVTPIGNDAETFLSNLYAGTPGGGPITTFDTTGHDVKIAAEVKGFDPLVHMDRKMARRMSRFIHFGVAAAVEAVDRAGLSFEGW